VRPRRWHAGALSLARTVREDRPASLGAQSVPHLVNTLQQGIYRGFIAPIVLYAGLAAVIFRNRRKQESGAGRASHEQSRRGSNSGGWASVDALVPVLVLLAAVVWRSCWSASSPARSISNLNNGYPWASGSASTSSSERHWAAAVTPSLCSPTSSIAASTTPSCGRRLLTSLLGYGFAALAVIVDLGRFWGIWKVPVFFWRWTHSPQARGRALRDDVRVRPDRRDLARTVRETGDGTRHEPVVAGPTRAAARAGAAVRPGPRSPSAEHAPVFPDDDAAAGDRGGTRSGTRPGCHSVSGHCIRYRLRDRDLGGELLRQWPSVVRATARF